MVFLAQSEGVGWLGWVWMMLLLGLGAFMILLVLLQRGRGGGLVGALGGAGGQSAFGTRAGDVFTRITIIVATLWVATAGIGSIVLRKAATPSDSVLSGEPALVAPGVPETETASQVDVETTTPEVETTSEPEAESEEPAIPAPVLPDADAAEEDATAEDTPAEPAE